MAEPFSKGQSRPGFDFESLNPAIIQSVQYAGFIDKTLVVAPSGRYIQRDLSTGQENESDVIKPIMREVAHLAKTSGVQRVHWKKYVPAVRMVLSNAYVRYEHNQQTLYSRNTSTKNCRSKGRISDYIVTQSVDWLAEAGYLRNEIGSNDPTVHVSSWFEATDKLIALLKQYDIRICRNGPELELRDKDKRPLPISKNNLVQRYAAKLTRPVKQYNSFWRGHSVTLTGGHVVPYLQRICTRELQLGGRMYGYHQFHPKLTRSQYMIDGEKVCELDYSGLHINLLYAEVGIQFIHDVYNGIGFIDESLSSKQNRKLLKAFMLRLVNTNSLGVFKRNVDKSGDPKIKQQYARHKQLKPWTFLSKDEYKKRYGYLKGFIEGVPDGVTGDHIINLIKKAHKPIAHFFGNDDLGLKLQHKDSEIMSICLGECIKLKMPVLPVHDSVICRVTDADSVKMIMLDAYFKYTNGHKITVN